METKKEIVELSQGSNTGGNTVSHTVLSEMGIMILLITIQLQACNYLYIAPVHIIKP